MEKKEVIKKENVNKVEEKKKIKLDVIKKLKCDYEVFKRERDNAKMRVPNICEVCGRRFEQNDNVYVAWGKDLKEIFICKECAEGKDKQK